MHRSWYLRNRERISAKRKLELAGESETERADRLKRQNIYMAEYRKKHGRRDRPCFSDAEMLHRSKSVQRWLEKPRLSLNVADLVRKEAEKVKEDLEKKQLQIIYVREKARRRRARLKGNVLLPVKASLIRARFAEFDNCCAYCGAKHHFLELHIEHFVPISKGGTHVLSNIIPSCKACNYSKRNHDPKSWYESQEFYCRKKWLKILRVLGKSKVPHGQLSFL